MEKRQDVRLWLLTRFLVLLPFLAKVSFEFTGLVPSKFWILIFQHGMHPYVNIALSLLAGAPLIFLSLSKSVVKPKVSVFYRLFVAWVLVALWSQGLLQILFDSSVSKTMTLLSVFLASFLVVLYGWVLPRLWNLDEFLVFVGRWAQFFVVLSLILWIIRPEVTFKGTRFIGVFKHIPYMVTCATVACIFTLQSLTRNQKFYRRLINIALWVAGFWSLLLTGTRSATFAVVLSLLVYFVLVKPKSLKTQFLKLTLAVFALCTVLLFGNQLFDYAHKLVRGEQALAGRKAQDGIKARMEEVQRGLESFQESPWLGQGLLSKFHSADEGDLAKYDAMKDPHNIFISAGVLGGWGFMILTAWGILFATLGGLKALLFGQAERQVLALYVLSHIPILVIYHVHLSLGGLADRLYWLVFGLLAVQGISYFKGTAAKLNADKGAR